MRHTRSTRSAPWRRRPALATAAALATGAGLLAVPAMAQAADVELTPDADGVSASTSDENVAANAVDGDLRTRWSGEGDGAWLELDLGSTETVTEVRLAVHQGTTRQNVFEIQAWDGSGWQTVYDGESSGTTTQLETFAFEPVETSRIRYLGHGYEGEGEGDWNSLTEIEVWSGDGDGDDGGGDDDDPPPTAEVPADVLDLSNWKVTLPIGEEEDPTEIFQPELASYSHDEYFTVTESGDGVRFRAPINGVTTGGSSNPRSELREMVEDGSDEIAWSATEGTHTMTLREAFTSVPEGDRPYVVGAQIHGGDDDITALRLEGSELWITDGDTRHHHLITDDYELGTFFEFRYVVSDGEIDVYFNGQLETTLENEDSSNYFKAGAYTQANCENANGPCSDDNYGETVITDLAVSHGDGSDDGSDDGSGDGDGDGDGSDDSTQAAVRYDWGTPHPISDEFDYTGAVDPERWDVPSGEEGGTPQCWPGHADNGRRCGKNSVVGDGILTMTGEENGDTGWIRQNLDTQYGRWEIRSRSRNVGDEGGLYHPLHLIWPTAGNRLENGEYDWVEYSDPDADCLSGWLHYPQSPTDEKERVEHCPMDMNEWHNFAFEWTPDELVGYVDGEEWFRLADGANEDRGNIQDMPLGNLVIQLDNFTGDGGLRPAVYEVDWVRFYEVN
ncbi:polysaccharide lyase family 7 protein [Streptomyces sp. 4N509B]|uniref:polysaccharide lyase family 7 protein n=1 Tax=Streptomyces sp. 4N509B TaxID=3457413 RepID=UPI003FD50841